MESNRELVAAYVIFLLLACFVGWAIYHGVYLGRGVLDN